MRPRLRGAASPRYGKGNKNKNVGFTKDEELGSEGREEVQSSGYPRPSVEGTGNTDPGKLRHRGTPWKRAGALMHASSVPATQHKIEAAVLRGN